MASPTELVALQETLYRSGNPTRRWLHCSRRDWIIAALRRYASPGGQALEVGPGCGVYLPVLAGLFGRVVAADIEDAYLAMRPACAGPCRTSSWCATTSAPPACRPGASTSSCAPK